MSVTSISGGSYVVDGAFPLDERHGYNPDPGNTGFPNPHYPGPSPYDDGVTLYSSGGAPNPLGESYPATGWQAEQIEYGIRVVPTTSGAATFTFTSADPIYGGSISWAVSWTCPAVVPPLGCGDGIINPPETCDPDAIVPTCASRGVLDSPGAQCNVNTCRAYGCCTPAGSASPDFPCCSPLARDPLNGNICALKRCGFPGTEGTSCASLQTPLTPPLPSNYVDSYCSDGFNTDDGNNATGTCCPVGTYWSPNAGGPGKGACVGTSECYNSPCTYLPSNPLFFTTPACVSSSIYMSGPGACCSVGTKYGVTPYYDYSDSTGNTNNNFRIY